MKIDLTVKEATLIYELLHEIKLKCVTQGSSKKDRAQAKRMIEDCNGLMKKVEESVFSPTIQKEHSKKRKKK